MPCNKTKCLKQVNPDVPDIFFGVPFEYDENWMGCYLCRLEDPKEEILKSSTGKFTRRIVNG